MSVRLSMYDTLSRPSAWWANSWTAARPMPWPIPATISARDADGGAYSIALCARIRNPTEPQLPSGPKTCDSPAAANGYLNDGLPAGVPTTVTRQNASRSSEIRKRAFDISAGNRPNRGELRRGERAADLRRVIAGKDERRIVPPEAGGGRCLRCAPPHNRIHRRGRDDRDRADDDGRGRAKSHGIRTSIRRPQ